MRGSKQEGWIRRRRARNGAAPRRRAVHAQRNASKNVDSSSEIEEVSPEQVHSWCATDECAVDAIDSWRDWRTQQRKKDRVRQPPLVSFPPLDRASLRPGHVLEIVGPSGSGKTELLIEAAVSCILPTKFKEVNYGGLQGPVLMFDLDGRFDMSRFVAVLGARIDEAHSKAMDVECLEEQKNAVFVASLRRFYRMQCFKSFEFLAALKTLHVQSNKIAQEHHGKAVQLVLIDGIGTFYWLDWIASCAAAYTNRTMLGVQKYSELIVRELRRLRSTKLFLVLATKSLLYPSSRSSKTESGIRYREYMPAAWQKFVTHRLLLQLPQAGVFTAQWDKPSIAEQDRFIIQEQGLVMIDRVNE